VTSTAGVPERFLQTERACLESLLPGLDAELADLGLTRLEGEPGLAIQRVKASGAAGLCISTAYAGLGATPRQAAYVVRALASRAPSATVGMVMHHFSVATLGELARRSEGMEWLMLEAIAKNHLLVASAFAEGHPDGRILDPTLTVETGPRGLLLSGVKKPCSLSLSMDLLSVSLVTPPTTEFPAGRLAVGLVSAHEQGISVHPFWASPVLAAAETGEVRFDKVRVDSKLLSYSGAPNALDDIQTLGLVWFQLLISATYVGIASALAERVFLRRRIAPAEAARLAILLEGAMTTLVGLATLLTEMAPTSALLTQSLYCRYAVQEATSRAAVLAFEWCGGVDFATSPEVAMLMAASHALAFHPPSRPRMLDRLGGYLLGNSLDEI
jgi:alkylation response protein AidB-like acyl-CoA dehydrogenase